MPSRWPLTSCAPVFLGLILAPLACIVLGTMSLPAISAPTPDTAGPRDSDRLAIALEALQKLKGMDLQANPALQSAVWKVVLLARGTPQFVELIRDFKIPGQDPALLEFAIHHPNEAAGVEAIRLVLANGQLDLIRAALSGTNALPLVEVLGNAAEKSVVPVLTERLTHAQRDQALQAQAVHALAQTKEGAHALLDLARQDQLSGELKSVVGSDLRKARWPEIQAELAKVLPLAAETAPYVLPPIAELVKLKGNPARGAEVFSRESVGCSKCHQVNGHGTDFGPNLSEIGTKLAKEAIYEAILDPSAGIAFGYEAWVVELRNGDEAYGLLASETSDEIAIKLQSGIVTRIKKSEIVRRTQQKTSIMPTGLAQLMSQQDLVDLVEHLASLKKPLAQAAAHAP